MASGALDIVTGSNGSNASFLRHSAEILAEKEGIQELAAVAGEVFTGRKTGLPAPTDDQIRAWTADARWQLAELLEPEE